MNLIKISMKVMQKDMITIISSLKKKAIDYYLERLGINCKYYYNANGKPLMNNSNLFISKTNKEKIELFAISNKEIGIDIEIKKGFPLNFDEIKKFFNLHILHNNKNYLFENSCIIWTILEAYTKFSNKRLYDLRKKENIIIFNNNDEGLINGIEFKCFSNYKYIFTIVQKDIIKERDIKYETWNYM